MGFRGASRERISERSRQVAEDRVVDLDVVEGVLTRVLDGDRVRDLLTDRPGRRARLQDVQAREQDVSGLLQRHGLLTDADLAAVDYASAVEVRVDVARHVRLG